MWVDWAFCWQFFFFFFFFLSFFPNWLLWFLILDVEWIRFLFVFVFSCHDDVSCQSHHRGCMGGRYRCQRLRRPVRGHWQHRWVISAVYLNLNARVFIILYRAIDNTGECFLLFTRIWMPVFSSSWTGTLTTQVSYFCSLPDLYDDDDLYN